MASDSDASAPALAIATCSELPELDEEGRLLRDRLREAGIAAEPAVWDDPGISWEGFDRVLLRTTWDYAAQPEEFAAWARTRGKQLINPVAAVEWNLSKRYLEHLDAWGFPVVPTQFVAPGQKMVLPADAEFVLKPAVSAGSKDTARYRASAEDHRRAQEHGDALLAEGREVMLQPYVRSVDTEAETAVILLGGELSHCMRKAPLLNLDQDLETGLFREDDMQPRTASEQQVALALAVVERFSYEVCEPAYARVDLLTSDSGTPMILELELIEPSLFLDRADGAADRLVEVLRPRVAA